VSGNAGMLLRRIAKSKFSVLRRIKAYIRYEFYNLLRIKRAYTGNPGVKVGRHGVPADAMNVPADSASVPANFIDFWY